MKSLNDKVIKKQRDNLRIINNRLLSAFSFKQILTWRDVYQHLGYVEMPNKDINHLNTNISYGELKEYCNKRSIELEANIKGEASCDKIDSVVEVNNNGSINQPPTSFPLSTQPLPIDKVKEVAQPIPTLSIVNDIVESTLEVINDESGIFNKNDYGLHESKKEKAFLFWFQKKAIKELWDKIVVEEKTGVLLIAPTGVGKTFIVGGLDRRLDDAQWTEGRTWSHIHKLYITKSTIIEQTSNVLQKEFYIMPNVDTEVINIEMLRSKAGQIWIKNDIKIVNGEEVDNYVWKKNINPAIVYFDESQGARRKQSKQAKIIFAYNDLPKACLVSISATPFMRVCEAKAFAVSTHRPLDHMGFPKGTVLNNSNWPSYAAMIAAPARPDEYVEAAVERLMKDLDDWIVKVRGVKPQFKARNGVKVIPFASNAEREFYNKAIERFEKEKAKAMARIDAGALPDTPLLVILLKFQMAAEFNHARHFAADMYRDAQEGYAAMAAVKFKQTVIEINRILITEYGVSRDSISLIWGGGQTKLTKKQEDKSKIKKQAEKLERMGLTVDEMIADLGLEDVEDRELINIPEEWRLGPQSKEERQKEINKFQSGQSLYCIYTFKAGGVGLSLHHTDELTTKYDEQKEGYKEWKEMIDKWNANRQPEKRVQEGKARRKESGYVYEEDIPFITTKPRKNRIALTYNPVELVQGVGRGPRLTSLSITIQDVYAYKDTVEEDIGYCVSKKLRCLTSVIGRNQKEDWQDIIISNNRAQLVKEIVDSTANLKDDDEGTILGDIEEGDDDE